MTTIYDETKECEEEATIWGYMGLETKVAFFITQCNEIFT